MKNHPTPLPVSPANSKTTPPPLQPAQDEISRGKFGPVSALVVTFLAYLGSQIAALVILASAYSIITRKNAEEALQQFTESVSGQFLFIIVAEIVTLAILYWFMKYRKISLREIGLGRLPKLSDAGYAIICAIAYFIVTLIAMSLVSLLIPSINLEQEQKIGFESASGPLQLGCVFLALAVLVPITEEILVRGFLYSGLRRKLSRVTAALLASILFGAAHLQLGSGEPPLYVVAIDTFILSIFLIALREKTGSLWSGILVHALKNGVAFLALFVFHVA